MIRMKLIFLGLIIVVLNACVTDDHSARDADRGDEKNAQAANTYVRLGVDYMQKENYALAEKRFLRALELAPKSSLAHWTYAVLLEKLDNPKKAETSFKRAIKLNGKSGDAQNAYGAFLCRQDRVSEALNAFEKAINNTLYQDAQSANLNAGDCLIQHQRYAEAKPYINTALEMNEESAKANYLMAKLFYFEGRYAQSSIIRNRISVEARDNPGVLWLCVMTERQLGDRNAEAICTKNLMRRYPTSEEAESI